MSTKFEQLLDLIVNEENEKANELFHAIVVEKSREIYENLIAEEAEEESAEMDEAKDEEEEESVDEGADEEMDESDEEMDESMDLEDSYSMEAGDEEGDATDKFGKDIGADDEEDDEMDMGMDDESSEETAIMDIKSAIEELEAAFAELEHAKGGGSDMGFGSDEEPMDGGDDMMGGSDDMMGKPAFEGRRVTREYVEKVGNDWEKNSQKSQGQYVGSGSGDKDGSPVEGRSPIASGKNKPGPANVNGKNLVQGSTEGQNNTGTSPGKVNKGITPEKSEKFASGNGNVPGGKMGVKNLSKVGSGYPGNNKTPGPVGSGSGDKAGQTSVGAVKQFLKPAN